MLNFINLLQRSRKGCMWLGEISSCCCLPVLPHSAWLLHKKTCKTILMSSVQSSEKYFVRGWETFNLAVP